MFEIHCIARRFEKFTESFVVTKGSLDLDLECEVKMLFTEKDNIIIQHYSGRWNVYLHNSIDNNFNDFFREIAEQD